MDGEDLKLKHAELGFDAGGWLKIRKPNGEEISLQLDPDELITLADWLGAASHHLAPGKAKRKRKGKRDSTKRPPD
jgi:hypothetical protein